MRNKKSMSILLIEDDVAECNKFRECADRRAAEIHFIHMTGSSIEGLKYVQSHMPEAVILDLELHNGKGSGLQFLAELQATTVARQPLIFVTTNNPSKIVHDHVRDNGVTFVFYKRQSDYSPDMVISTLLTLRNSMSKDDLPDDLQTIESPEERRRRIETRIRHELDCIGVSVRYKGHAHLQEAIFLLTTKDKHSSEAVLSQIAERSNTSYSSVHRAIQTALNRAWVSTSPDDLAEHYTAYVDHNVGVPSPTELIHYYADKIRKTM